MTQKQFIQDFAYEIRKAHKIQEEIKKLLFKTNDTIALIQKDLDITSTLISRPNGK